MVIGLVPKPYRPCLRRLHDDVVQSATPRRNDVTRPNDVTRRNDVTARSAGGSLSSSPSRVNHTTPATRVNHTGTPSTNPETRVNHHSEADRSNSNDGEWPVFTNEVLDNNKDEVFTTHQLKTEDHLPLTNGNSKGYKL